MLEHMRSGSPFVLALAVAALAACSEPAGTTEAQPASTPPAAAAPSPIADGEPSQTRGPVIATLVTHDGKVSIVGHGGDLRVVVRKNDGTLLADGVTLAELERRDPDAFRLVKSATAGAEGGFLDATYRAPAKAHLDATLDR